MPITSIASKITLALLFTIALAGPLPARDDAVGFHFYGARDCPPCMAFKRDGLPVVEQAAAELGFEVAVNIVDRTRDVAAPGAYGETDALLRRAGQRLTTVYPPIFFVTRGARIIDVTGHDWRAALAQATKEAEKRNASAAQAPAKRS